MKLSCSGSQVRACILPERSFAQVTDGLDINTLLAEAAALSWGGGGGSGAWVTHTISAP